MKEISIGYLPLTDAATLIAAADFGFAQEAGVRLVLHRDVSWANLRDKLVVGHIDAAQMLGPLALATSMGLGQLRRDLRAVFVLNANGNALTVSSQLAADMQQVAADAFTDAQSSARALGALVQERKARGGKVLTFASVFPFSMHTYLLRHFLALGGLDPDCDVEIVVVPPSYTVDCIERGLIDGFCVGNPWNSIAVEAGKGVILAAGSEILPRVAEKVLAIPADSPLLQGPGGVDLIHALDRAAQFVADPSSHARLAAAMSERMGLPVHLIRRALQGDLVLDSSARRRAMPDFIRFAGDGLNRPDPQTALMLYGEMIAAGQAPASDKGREIAQATFDPALYDRALG